MEQAIRETLSTRGWEKIEELLLEGVDWKASKRKLDGMSTERIALETLAANKAHASVKATIAKLKRMTQGEKVKKEIYR